MCGALEIPDGVIPGVASTKLKLAFQRHDATAAGLVGSACGQLLQLHMIILSYSP